MNQIPNTITCLNVLAGTVSILLASRGTTLLGGLTAIQWAYICIGIAAVADFCDGLAARLMHAYSAMGKELDSLCDLVSFGVAPAAIMHFSLVAQQAPGWCAWIPTLIPVAAALRLAKFNIDTRQATTFLGLPVPANAIFWIGYSSLLLGGVGEFGYWYVLLPVVLLLCWLMVSEVKLFSLKVKSLSLHISWRQYTLAVAAIVLTAILGTGGLMWLIVYYVGFSVCAKTHE